MVNIIILINNKKFQKRYVIWLVRYWYDMTHYNTQNEVFVVLSLRYVCSSLKCYLFVINISYVYQSYIYIEAMFRYNFLKSREKLYIILYTLACNPCSYTRMFNCSGTINVKLGLLNIQNISSTKTFIFWSNYVL